MRFLVQTYTLSVTLFLKKRILSSSTHGFCSYLSDVYMRAKLQDICPFEKTKIGLRGPDKRPRARLAASCL